MTKTPASAAAPGMSDRNPAEAVTLEQNRKVDGNALAAESIWTNYLLKVEKLRAQQAAYRAALPTDPLDAIRGALRIMHPDGNSYPGGLEGALHLSTVLEAALHSSHLEGDRDLHESVAFVSLNITTIIRDAAREIDKASDLLGSASRKARVLED